MQLCLQCGQHRGGSWGHRMGCEGDTGWAARGCLQRMLREFGGPGVQGDMGCIGSAHVSRCVGGGEAMGGRELISWSLVSVQRLDWSPCLPASSQPAPAPPQAPCGSPSAPEPPSCHPGSVTRVLPVLSTGSGHRGPLGRVKEASAFLWPLEVGDTGHGAPDPAQEGPSQQPSPGGLALARPKAEPVPQPTPPPTRDSAQALLGLPLLG